MENQIQISIWTLIMPFGLTNAPAVFQALINEVLRDFVKLFMFVYLKDILIYSQNQEQHVTHVRTVVQWLYENQLFVKADKCEFEQGCYHTNLEKIKTVAEWPTPTTRQHLQRFLSFTNFYRRFINDNSQVSAPFIELTSTARNFK